MWPPFFNCAMEKVKDIFTLEMFGVRNEVKLEYASYNCNGTLALQLFCKPDAEEAEFYAKDKEFMKNPYQVPYGVATVNLPESELLKANVQFVDENNLPGIGTWLAENGIAKPLDMAARSGYCTYRAYEFNVPEKELARIISAREDVIAGKLISAIEGSGMKPCERTSRGDTYHIAVGTDIVLYKGGTDKALGSKPDVFLLASSSKHRDRDMWRLRNLPSSAREALARDINIALSNSRSSNLKLR